MRRYPSNIAPRAFSAALVLALALGSAALAQRRPVRTGRVPPPIGAQPTATPRTSRLPPGTSTGDVPAAPTQSREETLPGFTMPLGQDLSGTYEGTITFPGERAEVAAVTIRGKEFALCTKRGTIYGRLSGDPAQGAMRAEARVYGDMRETLSLEVSRSGGEWVIRSAPSESVQVEVRQKPRPQPPQPPRVPVTPKPPRCPPPRPGRR